MTSVRSLSSDRSSSAYYWSMYQMDQQCCRGYFHRCLCLEGVSVTFRHHLGTIAFGSSIIAIIDTLRTVIDLIKDRMEGLNVTQYGKCCLNFVRGILSCVRCCFQFLSRYTYIMVIHRSIGSFLLSNRSLRCSRRRSVVNGFVQLLSQRRDCC